MTEHQTLKTLLEGQTVVIVSVKKIGAVEILPMVRITKVNGRVFDTTEGLFTDNRKGDVSHDNRSITFLGTGENIISRTFTVVNTKSNIKRGGYKPYMTSEESLLWREAEEASWKW